MSYQSVFNISEKKLNFSGHGSFPFRFTWLPKGVQNVIRYPDLFLRDDAIVILGIGKNMVQSIRYWCESLDLITAPTRGVFEATDLGINIFGDDGWDPYLEHPATLWLLHWKLASRLEKGSTWYLAFSRWPAPTFSKDQLHQWILNSVENNTSARVTPKSLKRDIDVFVRTYVHSRKKTKFIEDSFDCPLVELGLISEIETEIYEFTRGERFSLPDEVFIYALLEYWENNFQSQNSLSFELIQHGHGGPGRIFGLTENATFERLQSLPDWTGMQLDTTAGMRTVYRSQIDETMQIAALEKYYNEEN